MSRVACIVVPGFPHHVTQRGNRRADVFYSDDDRRAYLRFLRQYTERHGLSIWAYCLMTNHMHLVAVPQREDSLAKALRDTLLKSSCNFSHFLPSFVNQTEVVSRCGFNYRVQRLGLRYEGSIAIRSRAEDYARGYAGMYDADR